MKYLPAAILAGAVATACLASAGDPAPVWKLAPSGVAVVDLLSAKESHDAVTLTFRNTSDKNIAAFEIVNAGAVQPGAAPWVRDCFTERAGCFPARGRDEAKIRPTRPRELAVAAVLFEDGAALGDSQVIRYLKAMRAGAALEVEREKGLLVGGGEKPAAQFRTNRPRIVRGEDPNSPDSVHAAVETLQGLDIAGLTADRFDQAGGAEQSGFLRGVLDARSRFTREYAAAFSGYGTRASTLNAVGAQETVRLQGTPEAALSNAEMNTAQNHLRGRIERLSVVNHEYYRNPDNQQP